MTTKPNTPKANGATDRSLESVEPASGVSQAILAPVVSSHDAERILSTVAWFSRSLERGVEFVTVIDEAEDRGETFTELAAVADRLGKLTRQPVTCRVIVDADPAAVVLAVATDRLVCMPTSATPFKRGHFVESYAAALLNQTTQPVILVGPQAAVGPHVRFEDIVIAVAGDEECLDVLPVGRRFADQTGLDVRLVHVLEENDEHVVVDPDGRARLWFPGSLHTSLNVELLAGTESTAQVLAPASEHSILMMATHARCGLERIAQGSIAFDTIAHARAPVVVVGPKVEAGNGGVSELEFLGADSESMPDELVYTAAPGVPEGEGRCVVVLDGSARAAEAIAPGFALASQCQRDFVAVGIADDGETDSTRAALQEQLMVRGFAETPLDMVPFSEMEANLVAMANSGDIVTVSAFGTWGKNTRLYRQLGAMVEANVPAVIGIGPQVSDQWSHGVNGPIVVCVDESAAVDETFANLHLFIGADTSEIILLHITDPLSSPRRDPFDWNDVFDWSDVAARVTDMFGIPVRTETIRSTKTTTAITAFARAIDASTIVMASYHRPHPGRPTVASTSLSVVAYAPCPVAVLCGVSGSAPPETDAPVLDLHRIG